MVLFTPKKLIFKGSKKQHQILAQTAYYQAGKIVVQTILPEQPPVALITLNTLGTTCSTSADTYIPIENIFNTQSCSFLESRLVSLYGGKAASLLIEYQQRFACPYIPSEYPTFYKSSLCTAKINKQFPFLTPSLLCTSENEIFNKFDKFLLQENPLLTNYSPVNSAAYEYDNSPVVARVNYDPSTGERSEAGRTYNKETTVDPSELTLLQNKKWRTNSNAPTLPKEHLIRTCFAGTGNNIFQSTLGNIEIQTATRLAKIMVNYWNFYSLNSISLYSPFKERIFSTRCGKRKYVPPYAIPLTPSEYAKQKQVEALYSKAAINSINGPFVAIPSAVAVSNPYAVAKINAPAFYKSKICTARVNHYSASDSLGAKQRRGVGVKAQYKNYLATQAQKNVPNSSLLPALAQRGKGKYWQRKKGLAKEKELTLAIAGMAESLVKPVTKIEGYTKREYNVRGWDLKLKVKDKTPQRIFSYILSKAKKYQSLAKQKGKGKFLNDAVIKTNIIYRVKNNLYFAIAQSKNSLKIYEDNNSSYNIQRLSVENIGNYSQLNNNNFQLINSLQFSNLQRDRFYPNWFRLYLPDMEATEFLKNVANYYFSLGLQTLTFPSTKSSYYFTSSEAKGMATKEPLASPFLTFLNKNIQKLSHEKYKLFISNIISYTYCPPSILINSTSDKSINSYMQSKEGMATKEPLNDVVIKDLHTPKELEEQMTLLCKASASDYYKLYPRFTKGVPFNPYNFVIPRYPYTNCTIPTPLTNYSFLNNKYAKQRQGKVKRYDASLPFVQQSVAVQLGKLFVKRKVNYLQKTKVVKDQLDPLNVPFSLLLENQIFPLNYNGFSTVEKELLCNALVNSSFAKAFYLINQNRQLLDFFVDYLLRFQILRQHQILYLFSTLLLGCNKTV